MSTDDPRPTDPGAALTPAQALYRRGQLIRWRWLISAPALVDMLGLFTSYLVRPMSPTSTATPANSVVVAFDVDYPGLWPTAFGIGTLGIVAALITARGLTAAHVVAFTVLVLYTVALIGTAHLSHGGWATASLAGGSAVAQFVFAQVYARVVTRDDDRHRGGSR